jgi:hypothetical protein
VTGKRRGGVDAADEFKAAFLAITAIEIYRHARLSNVLTPLVGLVPLALAQSALSSGLSNTASVKSAPSMVAP